MQDTRVYSAAPTTRMKEKLTLENWCGSTIPTNILQVYRLWYSSNRRHSIGIRAVLLLQLLAFYRFAHGLWIIYAYARNIERIKSTSLHMLWWWVCFLHYHRLYCVYLTENLCCLLNILVVCLPNIIETIVFIAIGLIFVDVISLKLIYIARTVIYAKCIDSRIIKDEAFSLEIQRQNIFVHTLQRRSILARYIGTIYS